MSFFFYLKIAGNVAQQGQSGGSDRGKAYQRINFRASETIVPDMTL